MKYGVVKGLKNTIKKEPPVFNKINQSFLRYSLLNKLYDIFGLKVILLIRYLLGKFNIYIYYLFHDIYGLYIMK